VKGNSFSFSVSPRFVKQEGPLRPFQFETIKAIKDSSARLLLVEAPVGSGKSHLFSVLLNDSYFERKPLIFTYPTKILMEAQIGSMRNSFINLFVYPPDKFSADGINLFFYSSSSLVKLLESQDSNADLNRSEILAKAFKELGWYGRRSAIVTSPDVLYLLVNKEAYRASKRLQNFLQGAIFFFDEFHLYANLQHFYELVEVLLGGIASKVVLLSATPYYQRQEMETLSAKYEMLMISFDQSIGNEDDFMFNYPLEVEVYAYKYTDRWKTLSLLKDLIPRLKKPMAVIFDSVFRLRHLKRALEAEFSRLFDIREWSGMQKDKFLLNDKTVILGTSAIEVGIDMDFKTLITEVSYWTSAIQRIGRVARKSAGKVVILTNRDFAPYLEEAKELSRDSFEEKILMKVLKDPVGYQVAGEMFRGDSYNFILVDAETGEAFPYSESLFAMYEVDDLINDWRALSIAEKLDGLRDFGIRDRSQIDWFMNYDRLFPFWGVVKGRLSNAYYRVDTRYDPDEGELLVSGKENHYFYKE
jgi:CRISPR-associated helicase Cas3